VAEVQGLSDEWLRIYNDRLLGVPSYIEGELLQLPAVTIAFAQITQRTLGRKLALVAAAAPVAIVANAVRVTAIVPAVQYWGPQAASGWIHHMIGKGGVWALTLLPLIGARATAPAGGAELGSFQGWQPPGSRIRMLARLAANR
jgi:exosortase/archaeosortase family protein